MSDLTVEVKHLSLKNVGQNLGQIPTKRPQVADVLLGEPYIVSP